MNQVAIAGKNNPWRGNSKCKGPGAEVCLANTIKKIRKPG